LRVLLAHNRYRIRGGEDASFDNEVQLLRLHGVEVREYIRDNRDISNSPGLKLGLRTVWSSEDYHSIRRTIQGFNPDVVHFHNNFPLISPAGFFAAGDEGVPVVQTIHNYRIMCPAANLFRNGKVCEDCVGKTPPLTGVRYACYRGSRPATTAVAAMITVHRLLRTWKDKVDVYITLTEFTRAKLIQGGLSPGKIIIKPNFVHPDPGFTGGAGRFALFAGRLAPEKGIELLLDAWKKTAGLIPLKMVGDGPLAEKINEMVGEMTGVEWLGTVSRDEVHRLMREAAFLVFPSIWYECLPVTIIEAFAVGTPVIASRIGSLEYLIDDGRTGFLFESGNPEALAEKVRWAVVHPDRLADISHMARREFEDIYTADKNYTQLMDIYDRARRT